MQDPLAVVGAEKKDRTYGSGPAYYDSGRELERGSRGNVWPE